MFFLLETITSVVFRKQLKITRIVQVLSLLEYYVPIAMIIVLHLLNNNRDHVTCLYWSYKFLHFLACPYITFCKQTWPNICEHIIQIGLQSSQWTNN